MKRTITQLLLCALVSIGVRAQEDVVVSSARFDVSDDGTTLTISGQGDLTTLSVESENFVFTSEGRENLKTEWGDINTWDEYNASFKYKAFKYVKASLYPDYVNAQASYSWNESGLELYYTSDWGSSWNKVESTDVIHNSNQDIEWINGTGYSLYSTASDGTGRLTKDQFTNGGYYATILSDVTFKSDKVAELYVQEEDGSYSQLSTDAVYDETKDYYVYQLSFVSEEEMAAMGYIESPMQPFADVLKKEINDNSFTTVRFENIDVTSPLYIDNAIVHAILYPKDNDNGNATITNLDFGAATVNDLTYETFAFNADSWSACKQITDITLPLTKLTEVQVEKDNGEIGTEESIIVPTGILRRYHGDDFKLTTVTIPEGYHWIDKEAFAYFNGGENYLSNNTVTTFNFPSTLTLIGENAFRNCSGIESLTLNEGLENIGKYAFIGTFQQKDDEIEGDDKRKFTEVKLPSTLRIINEGAFALCQIKNLRFNEGLYYIGDKAFGLLSTVPDNVLAKTLSIPASVKYIGPGAFYCRRYQAVYFYGDKAPLMPMRDVTIGGNKVENLTAFTEDMHNGNSGFRPSPTAEEDLADKTTEGYANRENYKNKEYFCVLHYPTGLSDDARAEYTDITRAYKSRDEKGEFNASAQYEVGKETSTLIWGKSTAETSVNYGYADTYLGEQYVWPSQSQWGRAYAVNSNGFNWDGVTPYRSTLTEEDLKVLKYAGFEIVENAEDADVENGKYTEDELTKIAHLGTRQFVLANPDVAVEQDDNGKDVYPIPVEGGNWWTLCLPFDMTKKQVDEVFGSGTHVCRFSSVSRTETGEIKNITLRFQNDVYATKWERNSETLVYTKQEGMTPADDDVVIYSHEAYMIYPTIDDKDAKFMINMADYTRVPGFPLPTIIKANNEGDADRTEYRFVGNYTNTVLSEAEAKSSDDAGISLASYERVKIPAYSYIYAKKKGHTKYQFWFITDSEMNWSPNKCVVQATERDKGAGQNDFENFFGGNAANNTKVMQVSMFGNDGSTTDIENITVIAGEGDDAQVVYSIDGKKVRTDGLSKGVYIRGGKKFVVR